jgi:phosphoribosylformylglycinamidine synthase
MSPARYVAKIHVTLKKSVLDPQGKTVLQALHSLGFRDAEDLRVGKYFEVQLASTNRPDAEAKIKAMCEKLLINPVIEQYQFAIDEGQKS